jgi:DNA-binding GntR family transcriptional regulator
MTALKRIEREPLWDLAHAQLRDALLAGRFAPGTVLTLRALAESFGTSITPVRDAVTRLVAQGVLQQGPRNAAIVPHLTASELADLTVVRCALEGQAAREAATRRNAAGLERLKSLLATVLSFVIPEYVVLLKGWDHHTAALKAIVAGDADAAEREIVADITEAADYLASLADANGQLRRPLREALATS